MLRGRHPGRWPKYPGPILDWLVGEARRLPDGGAILRELGKRLVDAGLPLRRASFHIRTLHPQLFGVGFYWQRGSDEVRVFEAQHGIQATALFLNSPMRALFEGAVAVRQRLDLPDAKFAFPLFHELREEGLTDYLALPMTFSDGKIHGTTWSSDRVGGFESHHLAQIEDLLPAYEPASGDSPQSAHRDHHPRHLCWPPCRRAHPRGADHPRQRPDRAGGHLVLRSARLHGDVRIQASRRDA